MTTTATPITLVYRNDSEHRGKTADPTFTLDVLAESELRVFEDNKLVKLTKKHAKHAGGLIIAPLALPDGRVARLKLFRKLYIPGAEDIASISIPLSIGGVEIQEVVVDPTPPAVATSDNTPSPVSIGSQIASLKEIGDIDILAGFLKDSVGMTAKAAKEKATSMIEG